MTTERRREVRYPAKVAARVTAASRDSLERLADAEGRPLGDVLRECISIALPLLNKRVEARKRRARAGRAS